MKDEKNPKNTRVDISTARSSVPVSNPLYKGIPLLAFVAFMYKWWARYHPSRPAPGRKLTGSRKALLLGTGLAAVFVTWERLSRFVKSPLLPSPAAFLTGLPKHPYIDTSLHYSKTSMNEYLVRNCKSLREGFHAPWWCTNKHLQTIVTVVNPQPSQIAYDREVLQSPDGGCFALDWGTDVSGKLGTNIHDESPVALILHGLTGSSVDKRHIVAEALRRGFRPVVFNKRGHGGLPLSTPKLQSFGDTTDLRTAMDYIRKRYPATKLCGVGYSAGSGLLASYLGESGTDALLAGAVFISPGFDCKLLFAQKGISPFYDKLMATTLKKLLLSHKTILKDAIDIPAALKAADITEFDQRVYLPLNGYTCMDHYWRENNPMRQYERVAVPVLCINSDDDPICTIIPVQTFEESSNDAILLKSQGGGHCGFFQVNCATASDSRRLSEPTSRTGAVTESEETSVCTQCSSGSVLCCWADKVAFDYLETVLSYRK